MKKINYRNDFDMVLRVKDPEGNDIGFPAYDFEAEFWAGVGACVYRAGRYGDKLKNCYDDQGQIHILFNDHSLGSGPLQCELTLYVPDERYEDGTRKTVYRKTLDIMLSPEDIHGNDTLSAGIGGEGCCCESATDAEVRARLDAAFGTDRPGIIGPPLDY